MVGYSVTLLREIQERDHCDVDFKFNGNEYLTRDSRIEYTCICGQRNCKKFRAVYEHGAFCKDCIARNAIEKQKKTFLKKYGVSYPLQNP